MNKIDLSNKNAVITGGARGIGLAIATRLIESGAACSLWDIDARACGDAARTLSPMGRVHAAQVNVALPASVQSAAAATLKEFGRVDILVNNAGIAGATRRTWELAPDEWQQMLQINLFGPYLCCHALVPSMIQNGYGRIVNIASIAGKEGNPNASHYSAMTPALVAL